jgi:hypothetical protein
LKYPARTEALLLGALLLVPVMVHAQTNDALPNAPIPTAASTIPSASTPPVSLQPAIPGATATTSFVAPARVDNLDLVARASAGSDPYQPSDGSPTQGAHLDLTPMFLQMNRPADAVSAAQASGRFNMKGMLWQSLAFIGVENTYRLITDANMRRLTADKPYWADYIASMKQWNMRRWWDGDSILVDDVGHPMEGGVASFIEIQNSPRQRSLRFANSREYWRSRFLGMMWATVYSTQQKIGPLGEAALGSDGGITYPLNCPYPCKNYVPGVTKYTNNTGWTDFIMTPVVGSVWVVGEDFIDLHVSDRLQERFGNNLLVDIVRGAINPTRTMANFMRWRAPWYRDFQEDGSNLHITRAIHFLPSDDDVVRTAPRFEVFPHFNAISLPVNTASCSHCRQMLGGYGVGFSARLTKWIDFDSDVDYHSNASPLPSDRAGGNLTMGTFGFRSGVQYAHYSVKAAIRPGFLSYDHAYETSPVNGAPTPDIGRITHFTTALAINGDYILTRHLAIRAVIGNTPVRYREPTPPGNGVGSPPYLSWLSHQSFLTNENWTYQTGAVLRF